jgi:hypothetical protein
MRVSLRKPFVVWVRCWALLLLALQVSAAGTVALAHAADSTGGPVALESHHTAQCVTLHDAARCAQCQYGATRSLPAPLRRVRLAAGAHRCLSIRGRAHLTVVRPRDRASSPRAPPPLPL